MLRRMGVPGGSWFAMDAFLPASTPITSFSIKVKESEGLTDSTAARARSISPASSSSSSLALPSSRRSIETFGYCMVNQGRATGRIWMARWTLMPRRKRPLFSWRISRSSFSSLSLTESITFAASRYFCPA